MTRGPKEPLLIKRCLQQNISYENLSAIWLHYCDDIIMIAWWH
jgi:hypothetical protein